MKEQSTEVILKGLFPQLRRALATRVSEAEGAAGLADSAPALGDGHDGAPHNEADDEEDDDEADEDDDGDDGNSPPGRAAPSGRAGAKAKGKSKSKSKAKAKAQPARLVPADVPDEGEEMTT